MGQYSRADRAAGDVTAGAEQSVALQVRADHAFLQDVHIGQFR